MPNRANVTEVYNGSTSSGGLTQTNPFTDADFLIFAVPNLQPGEGYELAAALVVSVEEIDNIGGVNITTGYGTREITLDDQFADTQGTIKIPEEFSEQGLSMYLCLATTESIYLQIYAVSLKVSELDKLDTIEADLQQLLAENTPIDQNEIINQIVTQLLPQILAGLVGIPLPVLPGVGVPILAGISNTLSIGSTLLFNPSSSATGEQLPSLLVGL
jgi:hypothetical protein